MLVFTFSDKVKASIVAAQMDFRKLLEPPWQKDTKVKVNPWPKNKM
jgi:hypothetical protein